MLDIQYIYNTNKTTLPMNKEVLVSCINNLPIFGYVYCTYNDLVSKINEINAASEISVTKNPQEIFQKTTVNVEEMPEVIFKLEGQKINNDAYLNTVLRSNENDDWTDFSTYSKEFRDAIIHIKTLCFKKFLWNYDNIHNWFLSGDIQLDSSSEYILSNEWDTFVSDVMNTEDLQSFISCCSETDKQKYINVLRNNAKKIITKFKVEFMTHVDNTDRVEPFVTIHNPVINKIMVLSGKYSRCKKEFPMLNVVSISQRNFNMIGIWS